MCDFFCQPELPSEAVPRTDASYRSIAATRDQPAVGARR